MVVFLTGCGNAEDRENEVLYRQIGLNFMHDHAYPEALNAFDKALALSNGRIGNIEKDICYYKIDIFTALGRIDDAKELASSLITYDKKDGKALLLMGNLKILTGEEDYADYYDDAVKLSGDSADIYATIYQNLMRSGHENEASKYLDKALSVKGDEDDPSYIRSMAKVYYISGEYEAAMEYYGKLSEPEPDDRADMAECRFWMGDYEMALSLYEAAETSGYLPDDSFILGELVCAEYTGDFESAGRLMDSYIANHPSDEAALREKTFLDTRLKEAEYIEELEREKRRALEEAGENSDAASDTAEET